MIVSPRHIELFSANNLQTFVDCERRFALRYIEKLQWPAVESEPLLQYERHLRNGQRFHELAQQYFLDVPVEDDALAGDHDLVRWWSAFEATRTQIPAGARFPERQLVTVLPGPNAPLVATYDLIVLTPQGRAFIYDWKTSKRVPAASLLQARLQSRVYPYVLAKAGAAINAGEPIAPNAIEMVYWFAEDPTSISTFEYSEALFAADEQYLVSLVERISGKDIETFEKTLDQQMCTYCTYRSYCGRGKQAGHLQDHAEHFVPDEREPGLDLLASDLDDFEAISF